MNRWVVIILLVCVVGGAYSLWGMYQKHSATLSYRLNSLMGRKPVEPLVGVLSAGRNFQVGGQHIVALREGVLWGWGSNAGKELGLPNVSQLPIPKPLVPDRVWRYVSTGTQAIYAISPNGYLWRRGFHRDAPSRHVTFPQPVSPKPFLTKQRWRKVLESQGRTVGLDEEGNLWNWEESVFSFEPAHILLEGEPQVMLKLGEDGSIQHESDEELDRQIQEQAGGAALIQYMKDSWIKQYRPYEPGYLDTPAGRPVLEKIEQSAATESAARMTSLTAWKQAKIAARSVQFPAQIMPKRHWKDFCVDRTADGLGGPGSIYAVDAEGDLWKSGEPQFDRARDIPRFEMTRIEGTPPLARVFCRENGTRLMVIDRENLLWGFGANSFGELGVGDNDVFTPAKPVKEFSQLSTMHWVELALAPSFTVGISTDGALWAWGRNMDHELGIDDGKSSHDAPTLVDNKHTWVAVAAGYDFGAALTSEGELYTWGTNGNGQLGEGGILSHRSVPGTTHESGRWGLGKKSP